VLVDVMGCDGGAKKMQKVGASSGVVVRSSTGEGRRSDGYGSEMGGEFQEPPVQTRQEERKREDSIGEIYILG
jgi:hypothetical protein